MPAGRFNTMQEALEQANQILVGAMATADADLDFLTDLIASITDKLRSPFQGGAGPGGGPGMAPPAPGGPAGMPPELAGIMAAGPGQMPAQGIPMSPGGGAPPGVMPGVTPPNPDETRRLMTP